VNQTLTGIEGLKKMRIHNGVEKNIDETGVAFESRGWDENPAFEVD